MIIFVAKEKTESKPFIEYPVCVLDPSDVNGHPEARPPKLEFAKHMQDMLDDPSFLCIKKFILPKAQQPDSKYHIVASPLITWTHESRERMAEDMACAIAQGLAPEHDREIPPDVKFIASKMSLFDGSKVGEDEPILVMTAWSCYPYPRLLQTGLVAVCRFFALSHYINIPRHPGKVIRIPLSELRVRDIALYRYFKEMLVKADMTDIKVRTDNVQRPNSKEAITEPIYTFCANCLKVELNHERCSGCKVAYFCSAECQKQGWKLHKTECKERQKEQVEWDAIVASFNE